MIGRFRLARHALDPFCSRQWPSRAQPSTLLMGINPAVGSGCNHCMAHGTWDHASDRASITAPLPKRPTSVACRFLIIEVRDGAPVPSSSSGMAPHPGSRASEALDQRKRGATDGPDLRSYGLSPRPYQVMPRYPSACSRGGLRQKYRLTRGTADSLPIYP